MLVTAYHLYSRQSCALRIRHEAELRLAPIRRKERQPYYTSFQRQCNALFGILLPLFRFLATEAPLDKGRTAQRYVVSAASNRGNAMSKSSLFQSTRHAELVSAAGAFRRASRGGRVNGGVKMYQFRRFENVPPAAVRFGL